MKEVGGLSIDWDSTDYATAYDVQLSDEGRGWKTVYVVTDGNGGKDYVYLPEQDARMLRIKFNKGKAGKGYSIRRLEVKGPEFSQSPNDFFTAIASESPKGLYPKYFLNQQSYWTVVGSNGDTKEALINEQGAVEVDQLRFSLEPFLFVRNKLVTWSDVSVSQSLEENYLPIPSVEWRYGGWRLSIRAFSAGFAGRSTLIVTYRLENTGSEPSQGKLFIALRPFQVNPPWQWLNHVGGVSRIDSVRDVNGVLHVQDKIVIPVSNPSGFGATRFDDGEISEYLQRGVLPSSQNVRDANGFASAAIEYDFDIRSGVSGEFHIAVPFHKWEGSPTPGMGESSDIYVSLAHDATRQSWMSLLNGFEISVPEFAQPVVNTIKTNLAYIFINRDGPGIQPGSRSYERSWIRDGSLTSTALLQMGAKKEVREFIDWYAHYQFPSGKIPCVVDSRGGDATNEYDSDGEFIYAVLTYFVYTHDTTWLQGKFDSIVKTVHHIQSLRAERKTDTYRNGTPEQRACFGLVPESISHEGYSDHPRHSYWDDFFVMKGLKDATTIAQILGKKIYQKEFAAERDDFRKDLYGSMRRTIKNKNINYIPGCVELGDFDATSTTIGVNPCGELGNIPEPQLHNTFDKYYKFFCDRRDGAINWVNYTPYENRIIGTFVYLDERKRAQEAMNFFMHDRRPQNWNQWAEVVWRDSSTPKFIGDMPHTWCGSDFIRSVRAMFVYERERDNALVVGAGIPESWIDDSTGVRVSDLPTIYGDISFSMKKKGKNVIVQLGGNIAGPKGGVVVKSPLSREPTIVKVGAVRIKWPKNGELIIGKIPSTIEFSF